MKSCHSRIKIFLFMSVFLPGLISSGPLVAEKKEPKDLGDLICATGQTVKYDGMEWVCADDIDTNSDTLSALDCSTDQIAKYDGAQWTCADGAGLGSGPKIVFVTGSRYGSNLDGLYGADQICNEAATNAGLPGSYRAWLSTSLVDAIDRLTPGAGPYELVDGTTVALDNADLADGTISAAISLTQSGNPVANPADVWTGTNPSGTVVSPSDELGYTCMDWAGAGSSTAFFGDATADNGAWTYAEILECGESAHLYCFQQ